MAAKADIISNRILEIIPNAILRTEHDQGFYRFRFDLPGVSHWLYVAYEDIADMDELILMNIMRIYNIGEIFLNSSEPKRIYLSPKGGLREVDETFVK